MSIEKAMELSDLIFKYSKEYKIPAKIYTAILMQESSYNLSAVNRACGYQIRQPATYDTQTCVAQDLGISQINVKTIESYGFDPMKIHTDLDYSVMAGAKVLSWFHKTYASKEYDWWARYNVGTRPKSTVKTAWEEYVRKVKRWL